jgi:hypothetical protein
MPDSIARPAPRHTPWRRVLLGALVLLGCTQCRRHKEPVLFLLPPGFVGNVVVVYDQPHGQSPEYRAGTRVYRIPAGGVLYSRFGPNYGVGPAAEYRYTGTRTRPGHVLRYRWKPQPTYAPDDTVVCGSAPITDSNTPRTHYLAFVVAPNRQADSIYEQQSALIFRLAQEVQQRRALATP